MRSASYLQSSYSHRASPRRRAIAFVLMLAVHILLMVMLFRLAPPVSPLPVTKPSFTAFQLLPERRAASQGTRHKQQASRGAAPRKTQPKPVATAAAPTPPAPAPPLHMLTLSKEEYAASDISRLPSHANDAGSGSAASGTGSANGAAEGAGGAPGGERLYDADWYRKPTDAELAYYLPHNRLIGWGMIACQTVEKYHVDNCRELGDSPPGSGLAGAIRQAAWQFLVLPPRIGGRPIIGAWVRIRIDLTEKGVK